MLTIDSLLSDKRWISGQMAAVDNGLSVNVKRTDFFENICPIECWSQYLGMA